MFDLKTLFFALLYFTYCRVTLYININSIQTMTAKLNNTTFLFFRRHRRVKLIKLTISGNRQFPLFPLMFSPMPLTSLIAIFLLYSLLFLASSYLKSFPSGLYIINNNSIANKSLMCLDQISVCCCILTELARRHLL